MSNPQNNVLIINDHGHGFSDGHYQEALNELAEMFHVSDMQDGMHIKGDPEAYQYQDRAAAMTADAVIGFVGMQGYGLGRAVALAEKSATPTVLVAHIDTQIDGHIARIEKGQTRSALRVVRTAGLLSLTTALDATDALSNASVRPSSEHYRELIVRETTAVGREVAVA